MVRCTSSADTSRTGAAAGARVAAVALVREEELQPQPLLQVREEVSRLQQQARKDVPRLQRARGATAGAPRDAAAANVTRSAAAAATGARGVAASCARGAVVASA